jgi:hypothetical protein
MPARRQTKNAKVAKVTIPSTLAILATLTIFLGESRRLASRRRAESRTRTKNLGGHRQGRRQGGWGDWGGPTTATRYGLPSGLRLGLVGRLDG